MTVSQPADSEALQRRIDALELELESQKNRLEGIQQIGRALGNTLNLDKLLLLIMDKITDLMNAQRSTLFIIDEENGQLWSKIAQGERSREIRIDLGEGIAGWVAKTGQSINIKDAYKDSRFNQEVDRQTGFRTESMLCVPIRNHRRKTIGVVQVLNSGGGYFTLQDEALLSALGAQAAVSLENSKLYLSVVDKNIALMVAKEALQSRVNEIDLLFHLEQEMNRQFGLEGFLKTLMSQTRTAIPSQAAALVLRVQGGWRLYLDVDGTEYEPVSIDGDVLGVPGRIVGSGESLIDNDVESEGWLPALEAALGDARIRNAVCVPLRIDDDQLGAIALVNRTPGAHVGYSDNDCKMLTLVAGRAEAATVVDRRRNQELNANRLAAIGQALSGVLHDLKTPMTIIGGYAQLMVDLDSSEDRARFAASITRQLQALKRMTGEILSFARGDSNLLLRKVYLHTFLPELREGLEQELKGFNIELTIDLGYRDDIRMDIGKMERVIFNLVRNARQAMPDGGHLKLSTRLEPAEETAGGPAGVDTIVFEFTDDGPGIPEEIRHSLFESFVTMGKKGGTGLGLAIVKKVVELHGGTVDFDSELGRGTTFRLRLPRHMEN